MIEEARQTTVEPVTPAPEMVQPRRLDFGDPYVLGTSALIIGYALGSGHWNTLGNAFGRVLAGLGRLAMIHMYNSFTRSNAQFFSKAATLH